MQEAAIKREKIEKQRWNKQEERCSDLTPTINRQHRQAIKNSVDGEQKVSSLSSQSLAVPPATQSQILPSAARKLKVRMAQLSSQVWHFTRNLSKRIASKLGARSKEYSVIHAAFDHTYYLRCYADIANARIDPVKHYLKYGAQEGRDPSAEFVTKYYVQRYPDVVRSGLNPFYHYLTIGRAEGRGATPFSGGELDFDTMCAMLGRSPKEVERDLIDRRLNLRRRLESDILGEMVKRAGELEPLVHHSWLAAMNARISPFHSEPIMAQIAAMYRLHEAAGQRRARATIVMRAGGISGAARLAGRLATALAEIYGPEEIIVIRTDQSDSLFHGWFPSGCRHIDLAATAQNVSSFEKQRLLVEFLRSLRPVVAFNINSRLFWDAMRPYGRALANNISLYAYLFCNDLDVYGHWDGYPARQFYRCFDIYSAMITDSHYLAKDLREKFQIPPSQQHKLVTLDTPINNPLPLIPAPKLSNGRRPQIFWSGRFDRQKRVDIVVALAKRLPETDFRLWGRPQIDGEFQKLKLPSNIILEGVYERFDSLPLNHCDLWLYTSQWDGVPNVLLEVASAGIPLVGSLSGGCREVLIEGLCQRVENIEDVDAFEASIRCVLADPTSAREQARRLREQILIQRTPTAYRVAVEKLLPRQEST